MGEEAAGICRTLIADQEDAFRPYLASSLRSLSVGLLDLGRQEEAPQMSDEAVSICQILATDGPDAFGPELASSLHVLARGRKHCRWARL